MLEGATAHNRRPPGLSQHFLSAVDIPSLLLFDPVHIVSLARSLYVSFLHRIARTLTQLASFCVSILYSCMLQTPIHNSLRKEHAL